jgi:polyisoprenoid-binding protein YceI
MQRANLDVISQMKYILIALLSVVSVVVYGQSFVFQKNLSTITFTVRNFGVAVKGEFRELSGEFFLNEENIAACYFEAFVPSATIDTGIGLRDKHLKKEAYLDVARFPKMKIVSKGISRAGNQWAAVAIITIKGVSREATIKFTIGTKDGNRVFSGTFDLNRLDFGVGGSSFSLSDTVTVDVTAVAIHKN